MFNFIRSKMTIHNPGLSSLTLQMPNSPGTPNYSSSSLEANFCIIPTRSAEVRQKFQFLAASLIPEAPALHSGWGLDAGESEFAFSTGMPSARRCEDRGNCPSDNGGSKCVINCTKEHHQVEQDIARMV
jgi:hypothetical protein